MQGEQNRLDISNSHQLSKGRRAVDCTVWWPLPSVPKCPLLEQFSLSHELGGTQNHGHISPATTFHWGQQACLSVPPVSSLQCTASGSLEMHELRSQKHITFWLSISLYVQPWAGYWPCLKMSMIIPKGGCFLASRRGRWTTTDKVFCNWKGKHKCQFWLPATQPERGSLPRGRQHYLSDTHLPLSLYITEI